MNISEILLNKTKEAVLTLFNSEIESASVSISSTRKEFVGDFTIMVFPFTKYSKLSPEETGKQIGDYLVKNLDSVTEFNVVKGFLNLSISDPFWIIFFNSISTKTDYGFHLEPTGKTILVEYSSPNTNKPLHLGHIRNILLGHSVSEILKANGHHVKKVNLVNDRGIHICKSMIAWQKFGNGATPESDKVKGDHLVGKYYVEFDKQFKKEIALLETQGLEKAEAEKKAPIMLEAQEMLRKWEAGDEKTLALWKKMNHWVYDGFAETYNKLGVDFDKIYYESETYLLGKKIVDEGISKGILFKKEDGSVWIDLTADGLDQKLLLRSDGTSVYMTQDIGTAIERSTEFNFEKLIYVVGNEQDYHFKVLKLILEKLGYKWAEGIFHLSYGMVELPHGKMKSREGTVVDADELIEEMTSAAKEKTAEKGKVDGYSQEELSKLNSTVGMGALKYFMLKVDPKKKMLFNPEESVDLNGNTGPFIQYTYTRTQSILRKSKVLLTSSVDPTREHFNEPTDRAAAPLQLKEKELIKLLYHYPAVIAEAGNSYSPAILANYTYEIAKLFNQFYHELPVLKEENENLKNFRISLTEFTGSVIKSAMNLLGIEVPMRM